MSAEQQINAASGRAPGTEQEMHEFIQPQDPRGPPPPYNPYAPPPRESSNTVSEFLNDPLASSLHTFSKVTQLVQSRTPILNGALAGAQALHNALTRPPGTAERIYPELILDTDHSGPRINVDETPMPPPPLPIISNTMQANRLEPLTREEFDSKEWKPQELKMRVFKGGVCEDKEFRSHIWTYILDVYETRPHELLGKHTFDWTSKAETFEHYHKQWKSFTSDQEKRFSLLRERRSLIERDVIRCDRTHPYYSGENNENLEKLKVLLMCYMMHDFDTGYVQGMTDLASPLLYYTGGNLMKSFWFFANVMEFTHYNFEMSQNTVKLQLDMLWKMIQFTDPVFAEYLAKNDSTNCYFAFRWIVCQFKREFMKDNDDYHDIVLLWESIWTCNSMRRFYDQEKKIKMAEDSRMDPKPSAAQDLCKSIQNLTVEESNEPDSPLIDLNSVSMKELQSKDLAKENKKQGSLSGDKASTSNVQSQDEASPVHSSTSSNCSKKSTSKCDVLNCYLPEPKRLSDTELYVLCICLCIIRRERDLIMAKRYDATEILKHFNTLELNGDLKDILIHTANIWSWLVFDEKEELLYAELKSPSESNTNLANSPSNLNDDEYDYLTDVMVPGEDGFLN